MKVYTRAGSYCGHESSNNGWELVYDNPSTQMNGRGRATKLEKFDNVVSISSGQYQSFYVWAELKLSTREAQSKAGHLLEMTI